MIAGIQMALLYLAPAVLLLLLLACGRFPGERLIAWLKRARRRRRHSASVTASRRPARRRARGGRLLGMRLAGRGPPAAVA